MPILDYGMGSLTYGLGDTSITPGSDPAHHPDPDETVFTEA